LPLEAIEVFGARYPESLSREPIDPLPVLVIPTQHFLDELGQGWRLLTIEDLHFLSLYAVDREAVAVMKLVVVLFDKATLHPPVVLPKQTGAMLFSHSDPQAG
jgi:hypothetical protein